MSLALVAVTAADFDWIYAHMSGHSRYHNLHLREACQRNKRRDLRYLHAMHAHSSREIEGMISGRGVFWHYKLVRTRTRTQLNVLVEPSDPAARSRIQRRFLQEIQARIAQETAGGIYYPSRTPGQYYLRRWSGGTPATHQVCRQAVAAGVLDARFVSRLASWNLQLLCP